MDSETHGKSTMRNVLIYPVEALNAIKTNVWAAFLIVAGCALALHGEVGTGGALTTGGFAILRSEAAQASTPPDKETPPKTS